MKLYIDTSDSEEIVVKLDDNVYKTPARSEKSQTLLPFILKVLKEEKKNLEDVTKLEINRGPGSFTGLRVGAAVANALAWSLGLPGNFTKLIYSPQEDS